MVILTIVLFSEVEIVTEQERKQPAHSIESLNYGGLDSL